MADSTHADTERTGLARGAWLVVALLCGVALLNYLDRQVLVNMHDPVVGDIPMDEKHFGLLSAVFLVVYGLASPFGGYLADRFGRKPVIMVSLVVWSAATWATGHATSFEGLLGARAVMGFGEACYIPAGLALITDFHTGRTRAFATGVHMCGIYAGKLLGGFGGYYAMWFGWRHTFAALGLLGVLYAAITYFFLPRRSGAMKAALASTSDAGVTRSGALRALFRDASFRKLAGVVAVAGACNWLIMGWLPKFMQDAYKLSVGDAGFHANTWINLTMFVAVLGGGALSDALSRKHPRARALIPAVGFLIAAPGVFFGSGAGTLTCAALGFSLYGIAQGFFDANLMPVLRQVADARLTATGYGFLNLVSCASGGLMIFCAGGLKDTQVGFEVPFRIAAAGLLAAVALLALIRPARRVE